ncbi:MAG: ATP-binding protein [Candidatus Cloacimonetes bacterium]|nr:ATP-binding protein [Candidatus Cloacimonadota bacterium]
MPSPVKEVVVISGKGGTGKTSLTAAFAFLAQEDIVLADCDVDAPDMHLLMNPRVEMEQDFYSGWQAEIDCLKCSNCGKCQEVCRFSAIIQSNECFSIDADECEGCGYCSFICPEQAIQLIPRLSGQFRVSRTRFQHKLVHANLDPGGENSGKLVNQVKQVAARIAREDSKKIILVDGAPGIGCPVISSLTGADLVVLVTEPSLSAFHDLQRVFNLVNQFRIKTACLINKADLNSDISTKIKAFLAENSILLLAELAYNTAFTAAMLKGHCILEEENTSFQPAILEAWNKIISLLN